MSEDDQAAFKELQTRVEQYSKALVSEFEAHWERWPVDIYEPGPSEVIIGLLRRQSILALSFANNPGIWTIDVAPLLLRPMVEGYIYLAWILIDPQSRSLKFIEDGLGKEKLVIKHRTDEMIASNLNPDEDNMLNFSKAWIEEHKYAFYIDVNLGSAWSGLDVRQMADEARCGDFYRYTYPFYSASAHSRWNHVGKVDVETCQNPLHGFHRIPSKLRTDFVNPEFCFLAARYLDKMFRLIDKHLGIEGEIPSSLDILFDQASSDETQSTESSSSAGL